MDDPKVTFKDRVVEYVDSQEFFDSLISCTKTPTTDNDRKFKMLSWMVLYVVPKLSSLDPELNVSGNVSINFLLDGADSVGD